MFSIELDSLLSFIFISVFCIQGSLCEWIKYGEVSVILCVVLFARPTTLEYEMLCHYFIDKY